MRFAHRVLRVALLVGGALLVPSVASAHLALRRSEPADSASLVAPPRSITLWFTVRPQLSFSRLTLAGPAGEVPLGALAADTGNALRAVLPATLAPGRYLVRWQAASGDGHPIRGEFIFTVQGSEASPVTAPAAPHVHQPVPEAQAGNALYRGVRWIEFVALLTVLGVIGFHHLVLPALASRGVPTADAGARARRLGQSVLALYLPAALIRLYAESASIHGQSRALAPSELGAMLGTTWGLGWLAGIAGGMLILVGWRLRKHKLPGSTSLAVAGAVAMALSPALSGHAATGDPVALSVGIDVLHVLAAGVWVGGLLILLLAGLPVLLAGGEGEQGGHAAVAAIVHSFHPVALLCAPLVVVSGVASSWMRMGPPYLSLDTPYGRMLMLKVALFAGVALAGLYNSVRMRRRLGSPEATRAFRTSGWVEIALAAFVLAATTVLIVTPLPSPGAP